MNNQLIKSYEQACNFLSKHNYTVWDEIDRKTCKGTQNYWLRYYNYVIMADDKVPYLCTNNKKDIIDVANELYELLKEDD